MTIYTKCIQKILRDFQKKNSMLFEFLCFVLLFVWFELLLTVSLLRIGTLCNANLKNNKINVI